MFRVEFMVDDKKLGEALRSLAGVALGIPQVQPVINAEKKNGKVVPVTSGELPDVFAKYVKTHRIVELDTVALKKFLKHIGMAESSYTYFANRLISLGCVTKSGVGKTAAYKVKS